MTTPHRLNRLLEPIRAEMKRVEELLQAGVARLEPPLCAMLEHVLAGGKRLRPAFVTLTGKLFSRDTSPFVHLGTAVEMLHTATLIHDDIVDQSALRRGRRTLHTVWPVREAVLAGDHLLAQAAALVAALRRPAVLEVFAETLCAICAGQIRQTSAEEGRRRSREEYLRSIEAKTASLIIGALEMGGLLADASADQIAALRDFGHGFGLAFQIADDVLDLSGDEVALGKPPGSDLRQGVITLPTLCHLERGEDEDVCAVLAGRTDTDAVDAAIAAIRASGAIDAALAEGRLHAREGQRALGGLPDNAFRRILHCLADYVVGRDG